MANNLEGLKETEKIPSAARPEDRSLVVAKGGFKWKSSEKDEVAKGKARLVAKGYSQSEGRRRLSRDLLPKSDVLPKSAAVSDKRMAYVACEQDLDLYQHSTQNYRHLSIYPVGA